LGVKRVPYNATMPIHRATRLLTAEAGRKYFRRH